MRRIVATFAQILLGGWYGAGKNRPADGYGASKVTYRRVVSPGSGPVIPVGADQQATIRITLPGAGLPVTIRKSDQPAGG